MALSSKHDCLFSFRGMESRRISGVLEHDFNILAFSGMKMRGFDESVGAK